MLKIISFTEYCTNKMGFSIKTVNYFDILIVEAFQKLKEGASDYASTTST